MSVIGEVVENIFREILGGAAFHTARILLRILSFGVIRVQGPPGNPYADEPDFGWHNVIWKWYGKRLWISSPVAYFLGLIFWGVVLAVLFYCWRSFG